MWSLTGLHRVGFGRDEQKFPFSQEKVAWWNAESSVLCSYLKNACSDHPLTPTTKHLHGVFQNQEDTVLSSFGTLNYKSSQSQTWPGQLEYVSLKRWRWFSQESRHKSGHDLTHLLHLSHNRNRHTVHLIHHLHTLLLPTCWNPNELSTVRRIRSLRWLLCAFLT